MLKNIDQKLTGKNTVNINTCTHIFIQTYFFLNNNQCTGLNFTHIKACLNQLVNGLIVKTFLYFFSGIKGNNCGNNFFLSQLFQGTPQLRLKNYNYTNHQHIGQVPENPQDCIHFENVGDQNKTKDYQNTLKKRICPCKFNPGHKLIYKERNQSNLNNINHTKPRK